MIVGVRGYSVHLRAGRLAAHVLLWKAPPGVHFHLHHWYWPLPLVTMCTAQTVSSATALAPPAPFWTLPTLVAGNCAPRTAMNLILNGNFYTRLKPKLNHGVSGCSFRVAVLVLVLVLVSGLISDPARTQTVSTPSLEVRNETRFAET